MAGRADRARPAHERWCITVIRFPFTTNFRCMAATVQTLYSENRLLTPAKFACSPRSEGTTLPASDLRETRLLSASGTSPT